MFQNEAKENSNTRQPLFNHNIPRHAQIVIAQLRFGFTALNSHLFEKGCSESPRCCCGHRCENIYRLVWYCPEYKELRQSLLAELHKLNLLVPVNSDLVLYGNKDFSLVCNLHIQELFSNSNYIIKSKRKQYCKSIQILKIIYSQCPLISPTPYPTPHFPIPINYHNIIVKMDTIATHML